MPRLFLFLLGMVLLFSACSRESEIPFPKVEKKLVVNSLFTNDSLFSVSVFALQAMNEPFSKPIQNALVKIYCDGVLIDTLQYLNDGKYLSSWLFPEKGKSYTVEVNTEGYPTALATDCIPSAENVLGEAIIYNKPMYDAYSSSTVYPLQITLNDNVASNDFYILNLYDFGGNMYDGYKHFYDPIVQAEGLIQYYMPTIFFCDALFNGKQQKMDFLIVGHFSIGEIEMTTPLVLTKISEPYYHYLRGLTLQNYFKQEDGNQASDLEFMFLTGETYKVYSNVKNGYGIVAGYATENTQIKIQKN